MIVRRARSAKNRAFAKLLSKARLPMFNSGILDVAIGIVFIYLLVSLIVSAVNELCAALLQARGRILWQGISNLLPADKKTD